MQQVFTIFLTIIFLPVAFGGLTVEYFRLRREHHESLQELAGLKDQVFFLEQQWREAQQSLTNLRDELRKARDEAARLQREKDEAESQAGTVIEALEEALTAEALRVQELDIALTTALLRVQNLETDLIEAARNLGSLESELIFYQEELERVNAELGDARRATARAEQGLVATAASEEIACTPNYVHTDAPTNDRWPPSILAGLGLLILGSGLGFVSRSIGANWPLTLIRHPDKRLERVYLRQLPHSTRTYRTGNS